MQENVTVPDMGYRAVPQLCATNNDRIRALYVFHFGGE